jgi:hypothetical protein
MVTLHCEGAKTMKHYVEIIERKSGTVSKRINCHDQYDADKIELVLNKQLDHENFFARSINQKELFKSITPS